MHSTTAENQTAYLDAQSIPRPANFIPVYEPSLGQLEEDLVLDAVRSGWISSQGKYIQEFERKFASFCGVREGVAVSNGTVALHLALHSLGIGTGDEVIVPALTFVATANAVRYTGATPVFADVDPITWTINPESVQQLISPRTKAILPVHLYGHPAPMAQLLALAECNSLKIIEDCAEAHGAKIGDQRVGSFGQINAFSFMANKIITTGEGGMLTTNDTQLAKYCRHLRDHAMYPERRYWHSEIGFNYRMINLQAAVGVAQMQRMDAILVRKRQIAHHYHSQLQGIRGITLPVELNGFTNVYWMYSILVNEDFPLSRDELMTALRSKGIDSRPFFHPLDTLPAYFTENPCHTALSLSKRGINLPSAPSLTDDQILYISATLKTLAQSSL
jgi:perosamine synthetase